jgi:hypothetical protein
MGIPIIQEGFDHEAHTQDHQIISEHEAYEMYDDMLDDCFGDVKILNMLYYTSRALKDVDPIAYRCGFSDYTATLEEDNIFVEGITYPPNS